MGRRHAKKRHVCATRGGHGGALSDRNFKRVCAIAESKTNWLQSFLHFVTCRVYTIFGERT
jgi:hypothetical protein